MISRPPPIYEIESVEDVPSDLRHLVPSLEERQRLVIGDLARLCVTINGSKWIAPWVEVIEVGADGGYVGIVGGALNSPDWYPYDTRVSFGPENVIGV